MQLQRQFISLIPFITCYDRNERYLSNRIEQIFEEIRQLVFDASSTLAIEMQRTE